AVQQELRTPSRSLVRTEPPRRGLRGDVRRLARSRIDVGDAIRRMAGKAKTGIHGPFDARTVAPQTCGEVEAAGRPAAAPEENACRTLPPKARALRPRSSRLLRQRLAQALLERARVREEPAGRPLRAQDSKAGPQHRGELHRQLPVHDRSAARTDHRAL